MYFSRFSNTPFSFEIQDHPETFWEFPGVTVRREAGEKATSPPVRAANLTRSASRDHTLWYVAAPG